MTITRRTRHIASSVLFVGPILVLYTAFFFLPIALSFMYSLTDWDGLQKTFTFIGFANYVEALTYDEDFLHSVRFTFSFALLAVMWTNVLALLLALLVNLDLSVKNVARALIFMPNVISMIVVGFLWRFLYRTIVPDVGRVLHIGFLEQTLLNLSDGIVLVVLVPELWRSVGFVMIIYLAGLQEIPEDLRAAIIIDGASSLQRLMRLTIPFLVPAFIASFFITTTGSLKVFDIVFSLTGGGPGKASHTIAYNIYADGLQAFRFGAGSAKAVLFAVMVLVVTAVQLKYLRSKEIHT
ncbi:MAG: sugar ABC transporter permease [Spirochaetaceae bacterium]|nr:sugar ABC transporter permease [Spirochaetaceae bacterium]